MIFIHGSFIIFAMEDLEKLFGAKLERKNVSLPAIKRIVREELVERNLQKELANNEKLTVNEALFLEKMLKQEMISKETAYRILKENVTSDMKKELEAVGAKLMRQLQANGIDSNASKQAALSWVKKVTDLAGMIQGEAEQLSITQPPKQPEPTPETKQKPPVKA